MTSGLVYAKHPGMSPFYPDPQSALDPVLTQTRFNQYSMNLDKPTTEAIVW